MTHTATLDSDAGTLKLRFENDDDARTLIEEGLDRQSFFLSLDRQLKQFTPIEMRFEAPELSLSIDTEVMQVFPSGTGFGTALGLRDPSPAALTKIRRHLEEAGSPEGAEGDAGESDLHESVLSPAFRIRQMNPSERFRLALKATRIERQILLRDTSPQVLIGLLSHPQIEDTEVRAIVASTHASSAILHRVAENKKWMKNPEILTSVARNPKTPPPTVIKLLPQLRVNDLQIMARGGARENIRRAALKIYMQRTGQGGKGR